MIFPNFHTSSTLTLHFIKMYQEWIQMLLLSQPKDGMFKVIAEEMHWRANNCNETSYTIFTVKTILNISTLSCLNCTLYRRIFADVIVYNLLH